MANPVAVKGKKDQFSNIAFGSVTMSAANTLTFEQIQLAVGLFQGVAIVLHRLLWFPDTSTIREIVAATDSLQFAITTTNRLTTIADVTDPSILAQGRIVGVAANTEPFVFPIVHDFTGLPGGGKITAANPLYVGAFTGGFAAAGRVRVQMDFTFIELADRDYLELLQAQFPANIS